MWEKLAFYQRYRFVDLPLQQKNRPPIKGMGPWSFPTTEKIGLLSKVWVHGASQQQKNWPPIKGMGPWSFPTTEKSASYQRYGSMELPNNRKNWPPIKGMGPWSFPTTEKSASYQRHRSIDLPLQPKKLASYQRYGSVELPYNRKIVLLSMDLPLQQKSSFHQFKQTSSFKMLLTIYLLTNDIYLINT